MTGFQEDHTGVAADESRTSSDEQLRHGPTLLQTLSAGILRGADWLAVMRLAQATCGPGAAWAVVIGDQESDAGKFLIKLLHSVGRENALWIEDWRRIAEIIFKSPFNALKPSFFSGSLARY